MYGQNLKTEKMMLLFTGDETLSVDNFFQFCDCTDMATIPRLFCFLLRVSLRILLDL